MTDFTFKHYRESLQLAKDKGYNFLKCCEHTKKVIGKKNIVLRHDVDFTLENAVNMCDIESDLGIQSTYFIRLHAKNYHPFTLDNVGRLKYILSKGHEIGLHFEPDFYKHFDYEPLEQFSKEVRILEDMLGINIVGAATHEPSRCGYLITDENINNLPIDYEAYGRSLMDSYKYISDSGARWREGTMYEFINNDWVDDLYVNTHPLWWFEKTPLENY